MSVWSVVQVESPTVGAFAGEAASWRSGGYGGAVKGEEKGFPEFSFQPHQSRAAAATSSSSMSQPSSALVSAVRFLICFDNLPRIHDVMIS